MFLHKYNTYDGKNRVFFLYHSSYSTYRVSTKDVSFEKWSGDLRFMIHIYTHIYICYGHCPATIIIQIIFALSKSFGLCVHFGF